MKIRVGFGFDVHQLREQQDFWLGGIKIEHHKGAFGHSDADVLIHVICDALLGAANLRHIEANNKFNRGRYYLGLQYQHTEAKTIDLYFMNQREFNVNNPERNYIIGLEYAYSF